VSANALDGDQPPKSLTLRKSSAALEYLCGVLAICAMLALLLELARGAIQNLSSKVAFVHGCGLFEAVVMFLYLAWICRIFIGIRRGRQTK
jgi:hypothetical protein